jgi:thymidylate synthase ThyX
MKFTEEEQKLLTNYVSHVGRDIFAVKNLPGITGAVYARYSRAKTGFQETLLKEFIQAGMINQEKADQLIERVLVAYGDDSVGELEGAHVSFENISAIGEKAVVDHRIGGAFITQSTRYVYYDQKADNGFYRYYRDPKILNSPFGEEYIRVMDLCFDTYARLVPSLKQYLQTKKPIEEAEYDINGDGKKEKISELTEEAHLKGFKQTYESDLRAKVCDILRIVLPLSTFHNTGVFGNGRFFQGMISNFHSSPLTEMQDMGTSTFEALNDVIPKYVKRAKKNEYLINTEEAMQKLADELLQGVQHEKIEEVTLMPSYQSQEEFDIATTATMLYAYSSLPLKQLIEIITKLPESKRELIRQTYIGNRTNRRDRPGRAFEDGYPYKFDLLVTFQVFKDLMRHRMSSQIWQAFTPEHGFHIPSEVKELGLEKDLFAAEKEARNLYYKLVAAGLKNEAQYAVLHGHKTRWIFQANDRAVMHMLELRTTPQGHPEYRMICQKIHKEIAKRSPWRADAMKFVDHNDYYWSRADSEAKQRVKERVLDEKFKD